MTPGVHGPPPLPHNTGGLDTQLCLYTFERPSKPSKKSGTNADSNAKGGNSGASMAGALQQASPYTADPTALLLLLYSRYRS